MTPKFQDAVAELTGENPQPIPQIPERLLRIKPIDPIPVDDWPMWAKALKQFATPEDAGIGDIVHRMIGEEYSAAFKAWHWATFGKTCGCKGRQVRWNLLYPLK